MDPIGQASEFTAPIYFQPPPRPFDHAEPGISWISAEAKGFTGKTSPTSELDLINDAEANRALMIRFFRTMNIKHADVLAVWPPQSTLTKEVVRNRNQKATRPRTAIGNKVLSNRRQVIKRETAVLSCYGFVSAHDYDAYLFNSQRVILMVQIALPGETELYERERERALADLRPILVWKITPLYRT